MQIVLAYVNLWYVLYVISDNGLQMVMRYGATAQLHTQLDRRILHTHTDEQRMEIVWEADSRARVYVFILTHCRYNRNSISIHTVAEQQPEQHHSPKSGCFTQMEEYKGYFFLYLFTPFFFACLATAVMHPHEM